MAAVLMVVQPRSPGTKAESDPVGIIQTLLAEGGQRLGERRYELALQAYEQALTMDRLNQNAKKGLVATIEAHDLQMTPDGGQLVFTASLVTSAVPAREWTVCQGGAAIHAFRETRRRVRPNAA